MCVTDIEIGMKEWQERIIESTLGKNPNSIPHEHKGKDSRPSWQNYFLKIAKDVSERSNCCRRKVGAVIVKDNHIVSTGYNGTPYNMRAGEPNPFRVGVKASPLHSASKI